VLEEGGMLEFTGQGRGTTLGIDCTVTVTYWLAPQTEGAMYGEERYFERGVHILLGMLGSTAPAIFHHTAIIRASACVFELLNIKSFDT